MFMLEEIGNTRKYYFRFCAQSCATACMLCACFAKRETACQISFNSDLCANRRVSINLSVFHPLETNQPFFPIRPLRCSFVNIDTNDLTALLLTKKAATTKQQNTVGSVKNWDTVPPVVNGVPGVLTGTVQGQCLIYYFQSTSHENMKRSSNISIADTFIFNELLLFHHFEPEQGVPK